MMSLRELEPRALSSGAQRLCGCLRFCSWDPHTVARRLEMRAAKKSESPVLDQSSPLCLKNGLVFGFRPDLVLRTISPAKTVTRILRTTWFPRLARPPAGTHMTKE